MTTFNDLPMFILSIIEEFDKFPEKFTPYTLLPTMKEVQIASKLLGQHLVLSTPDRNAGIPDIYCPSLLWTDMLNMLWNNVNF